MNEKFKRFLIREGFIKESKGSFPHIVPNPESESVWDENWSSEFVEFAVSKGIPEDVAWEMADSAESNWARRQQISPHDVVNSRFGKVGSR